MMNHHPTYVEIDIDAFSHNMLQIRSKVGNETGILAMLKADAYGHGLVRLAEEALKNGAAMIGVGNVEEGVKLRENGISSPILVMVGIFGDEVDRVVSHNLSVVIYSYRIVEALSNTAEKKGKDVSIHIKVDTGMGRIGIIPDEVVPFLRKAAELKNISIQGILTHFAVAYEKDSRFTDHQISIFKEIVNRLSGEGFHIPLVHCFNSAAIINYQASHFNFNMVRPGIILYGSLPSYDLKGDLDLKPLMTWKTRIAQLKSAPRGKSLSYGRTYFAPRDSIIATIPVGYADGYSRFLSNRAKVIAKGKRVPQVGRICMDMCMIDVTDVPDVKVGDEVILLGKGGEEEITAEEIAGLMGTISYEIYCMIGKRVPRVYVRNGKVE
ncbi:MAG: alanine racemase [Nitrospinota bacterium]